MAGWSTKNVTTRRIVRSWEERGRTRFTGEDVERDNDLYCDAMVFAREYIGNFPFMVDMCQRYHHLSNRQAAGVLNCAVRENLRSLHNSGD